MSAYTGALASTALTEAAMVDRARMRRAYISTVRVLQTVGYQLPLCVLTCLVSVEGLRGSCSPSLAKASLCFFLALTSVVWAYSITLQQRARAGRICVMCLTVRAW